MKNRRLLILAVSLYLLIGCHKDNEDSLLPDIEISTETVESSIGDNSRIINHRVNNNIRTRTTYEMNEPTPPSNVISMANYDPTEVENGTSYILETGQTLDTDINFADNINYYIKGNLTVSDTYGSNGTVYILEDGDVIYEKTSLSTGHYIENYGELQLPSNYTIDQGASLMISNYFNIEGDLEVDGILYCADSTDFGSFTLNNTGDASFERNLRVSNTILLNQGELYVSQYLKSDTLIVNDIVNFDFKGPTLLSCSVIDIKTTLASIDNIGDQYSVIECDKLIIRNKNQKQFKGWVDIHASEIDNRTDNAIQWLSGVLFNSSAYISGTEYNPSFGEPSTEITYGLHHIAEVAPHEQNISATSIDFKGNNAYVSWHLVEAPLKGYIDILNIANLEVVATLFAANMDFNHIYVSEDKIYTAGDNKRGAFITEINYPSSLGEIEIDIKKIRGASGNCILLNREDSTTWAISGASGGVSIIDNEDEVLYDRLVYAKYIVDNGDNMLVLAGDNNTKIHNYSYDGTIINSYIVGDIEPSDGKNTIAISGDTVYVALGVDGVKAFVNGTEILSFSEEGSANCVSVDNEYVYVANGVDGFVVLNKSDFGLVTRHTLGDASANFVKKGDDDLLYVAYGRDGVNVYDLVRLNI